MKCKQAAVELYRSVYACGYKIKYCIFTRLQTQNFQASFNGYKAATRYKSQQTLNCVCGSSLA